MHNFVFDLCEVALFFIIGFFIWIGGNKGIIRRRIERYVERKKRKKEIVREIARDYLANLELNLNEIHILLQKVRLWEVPALFPIPLLDIISHLEKDHIATALDIFIKHCNTPIFLQDLIFKWWQLAEFKIQKKSIHLALEHHRKSQYNSVISLLLPLFERILRIWGCENYSLPQETKEVPNLVLERPVTPLLYNLILEPLLAFPISNLVYDPQIVQNWMEEIDKEFPTRQVGDFGKYDESLFTIDNSLKLFLALDTIFALMAFDQNLEMYKLFNQIIIDNLPRQSIDLDSIEEVLFEKKCWQFLETKQCLHCNQTIPIWADLCKFCKKPNPNLSQKMYTTFSINQKIERDDKMLLNYAGTGYICGGKRGGDSTVLFKNAYDDFVFLFQEQNLLWKKNFKAHLFFLNFIQGAEKILIISSFTTDEILLKPLDRLIQNPPKAITCDLCKKPIKFETPFWKGRINFLNDAGAPEMFGPELNICTTCRPYKSRPDFPVAHIYLLNFHGDILLNYRIILPHFINTLISEITVEPPFNTQFSVRLSDQIYTFDSLHNQFLTSATSGFGKITYHPLKSHKV